MIRDEGYRWLHPRRALAGCIYAAVVADTRALPLLPDERRNYFPATPFCTLSLFLEGESIIVGDSAQAGASMALPRVVLAGPQSGPTMSMNPGPVLVLSLGLFPEAVQALIGQDISTLRGRVLAAGEVLPVALHAACLRAAACREAEDAFNLLQDGIDPLWQATRPGASAASRLVGDWSRHLVHRAATSRPGKSLRQIERRMKAWTGQSHRELIMLGRTEEAFIEAYSRLDLEREDWADLAAGVGYADQPHLVRAVRRVTGFAPEQLRKRIKSERPFWYYRMMGELY